MRILDTSNPITAIVYASGAGFEAFLHHQAAAMARRGMRLAGLVQHSERVPGRLKCRMGVEDLATGTVYRISEDRGPGARGCVLDGDLLLRACTAAADGLDAGADLLVLSKFGKAEVAGGGCRGLIVRAIDAAVPVLIGVPQVNLAAFHDFAGDLAHQIDFSEMPA